MDNLHHYSVMFSRIQNSIQVSGNGCVDYASIAPLRRRGRVFERVLYIVAKPIGVFAVLTWGRRGTRHEVEHNEMVNEHAGLISALSLDNSTHLFTATP